MENREAFEVTCAECGTNTTVPFKPNGSRPVLCRDCFKGKGNDRGPRRGPSQRETFTVRCDQCEKWTDVPFKPNGSKPVLCRECFGGSSGGGGGGGRNDRGPRQSRDWKQDFDVTCAQCGTQTTVPFRPTGERPVLCKDCFRKNRAA